VALDVSQRRRCTFHGSQLTKKTKQANCNAHVISITPLDRTEQLLGFESVILPFDMTPSKHQVFEVLCRAIVFPMALRQPGRPKKIVVDDLDLLPVDTIRTELGIAVGLPDSSNDGVSLQDYACHECGKRLEKVQRCSACKAVNYCSRECTHKSAS